jgi:hypothetical protein
MSEPTPDDAPSISIPPAVLLAMLRQFLGAEPTPAERLELAQAIAQHEAARSHSPVAASIFAN